ncbi:MAG TPA: integrase core domain-containing protein, partial [Thermoanaerobaculaceae bacterium]|nr:integrase core domain-containing protein [Thermoanaerobaculaceae bacterium]
LGLRHLRTRPYRPRTNGKAERFIQTLQREWAYAFPFRSSYLRTRLLKRYLHFYNHHRAHASLGGKPPISKLNNVVRNNS